MGSAQGVLPRIRTRLFGDVDPVERQLADIAKQGAGPARVAHVCSTALIVLFSAASFVALGSDTLTAIQTQWTREGTVDVPAAISLSVITLMVLAFDVGMIYAANMLRNLATRGAGFSEMWVHVLVMVGVALIEASTYVYMAWRFERPVDGIAWALILMRAIASPLLAVYLSMARALSVTARDILAQGALGVGAGVLRDITVIANDHTAPLVEKLELYDASAVMLDADRTRLQRMTDVAQRRISRHSITIASDGLDIAPQQFHNSGRTLPAPQLPHDDDDSDDIIYEGRDGNEDRRALEARRRERELAEGIVPLQRTARATTTPQRGARTNPKPQYSDFLLEAFVEEFKRTHDGKLPKTGDFKFHFRTMSASTANTAARVAKAKAQGNVKQLQEA